ncbi:hypothetical protein LOTGIDRAFT_232875 [Lottia gigantea]|uniref:Calcyclin-binding protein n=1 Tax=Lottia gigantea TaxID=225164 RepID=V3ZMX2_LOTGI|nr:hypothetical protein LOTGIDRAFT_232875 [Lottia gigantea]ESO92728.1 hypothetical protein LOTGIDRAFT_232875 [Lottia gigantea]
MASLVVDELKKDLTELEQFNSQATRQRVKNLLTVEIRKVESEISKQQEMVDKAPQPASSSASGDNKSTGVVIKEKITKYGWDESDKFMKLYVTSNNVHNLDKEKIRSEFTNCSVQLNIDGLNNKNYELYHSHLCEEIDPSASYHKVKTDMVLLMLKKKEVGKIWSHVTAVEKKKVEKSKETPDLDKEDPNASMMKLLQKMYEEGDDEMKRTIAKSMSDSRGKQGAGMDFGQ